MVRRDGNHWMRASSDQAVDVGEIVVLLVLIEVADRDITPDQGLKLEVDPGSNGVAPSESR